MKRHLLYLAILVIFLSSFAKAMTEPAQKKARTELSDDQAKVGMCECMGTATATVSAGVYLVSALLMTCC